MSWETLFGDLLAKGDQLGLFSSVPAKPDLHLERHTDRRGRSQGRWVTDRKVRYFAATHSSLHGKNSHVGVMMNATRHQSVPLGVREGRLWALDNGAYSGKFTPENLHAALENMRPHADTCRFVVAPDVLGDAAATTALYEQWKAAIRRAGFPVAFVAHRGTTLLPDCDALFVPAINLDDPNVPRLVTEAKRAGKWVHVGRVNSQLRTDSMYRLGADSVDGTHTRFVGVERGVQDAEDWATRASMQGAPLLTEEHALEPRSRTEERHRRAKRKDQAIQHGGTLLSHVADADSGMLVKVIGDDRPGVLMMPPVNGSALVAFSEDEEVDADWFPVDQVIVNVNLDQTGVEVLTPRQITRTPAAK